MKLFEEKIMKMEDEKDQEIVALKNQLDYTTLKQRQIFNDLVCNIHMTVVQQYILKKAF